MAAAPLARLLLLHMFLVLSNTCRSCPEANSSCNGIQIRPPFKDVSHPACAGHFSVECDRDDEPREVLRIQLSDDHWYTIQNISYDDHLLVIRDEEPPPDSHHEDCLYNFDEPVHMSDHSLSKIKLLEESRTPSECKKQDPYCLCDVFSPQDCATGDSCTSYDLFYSNTSESYRGVDSICSSSEEISMFFEWKILFNEYGELSLLSAGLSHGVRVLRPECFQDNATRGSICIQKGKSCGKGDCHTSESHKKHSVEIGLGVGGAFIVAMLIGLLLFYRHRKRKLRSSTILLSRTNSIEPSFSKEDPELGTYPELGVSRYRTHVFTYEELHEATGGFNTSNELGDGGFGTVYKGVLRDGRVVAVKRLYQRNYRRLEQFMNEVDIISDLRHPHLVMLYGCTSRRSRDLLLVYEYVSNGTVADHLYGAQADAGFLTWPTRISIAVESADALAYLHDDGTQIIHRDVKTSNILLDDHFHVKVADFGLSRLFPTDATHVSTAPQGTPGYLDPEYHQCYQLTDKSDVYSFGVVLAELISSKPAVDVTRQRSEINLSNMAMNKILNQEMDQFVDLRLGYQSDSETRGMIDSVAELAFRCLQLERDMRPTMKEVLGVLRGIRSSGNRPETRGMEPDVEAKEDAHLLKNAPRYSPNSVTERWASVGTTPNASG